MQSFSYMCTSSCKCVKLCAFRPFLHPILRSSLNSKSSLESWSALFTSSGYFFLYQITANEVLTSTFTLTLPSMVCQRQLVFPFPILFEPCQFFHNTFHSFYTHQLPLFVLPYHFLLEAELLSGSFLLLL